LPVVSAVGHEVDFTIADFVADRRAPTPTAAAELVVPRVADLRALVVRGRMGLAGALARRATRERRHLDQLSRRLRDPRRRIHDLRVATDALALRLGAAMQRRLATSRTRTASCAHRLAVQHPGARAMALGGRVAALQHRLPLAGRPAIVVAPERVVRAASSLDDLSPLAVLRRGYSLVRRVPDGAIVRAAATLVPGDEVQISFAEGTAQARIVAPGARRRAPKGGSE